MSDDRPRIEIDLSPRPAPTGPRLHTCNVCGKQDVWGPTWRWLWVPDSRKGPGKQYHDPDEFKTCSPECRQASPYADWPDLD